MAEIPNMTRERAFLLGNLLRQGLVGRREATKYKIGSLRAYAPINLSSNIQIETVSPKTWSGFSDFDASSVWSDGRRFYCASENGNSQYVLNGDTWEPTHWFGVEEPYARYIWNDGVNTYCGDFDVDIIYKLNGNTWEPTEWDTGGVWFSADYIWSDGKDLFYSSNTKKNYVLNGNTWEPKEWKGLPDGAAFEGKDIWSDGKNIYFSYLTNQYVLDGDTWVPKVWDSAPQYTIMSSSYPALDGDSTFRVGTNIYTVFGGKLYILNGNAWVEKSFDSGGVLFRSLSRSNLWSDGHNLYLAEWVHKPNTNYEEKVYYHYVITANE